MGRTAAKAKLIHVKHYISGVAPVACLPFIADQLERLSRDLLKLRFRCGEPARSSGEAERRIAEGERIAAALRAAFRGGASSGHAQI